MNENDGAIAPASGPDPDAVCRVQGMWGVKRFGDMLGFSELVGTEIYARPASRPYDGWFDSVVGVLAKLLEADGVDPDAAIEKVVIENDRLVLFVAREHLVRATRCLHDDQDLRFEMCFGVTGVHYPQDAGRELHGYSPLSSITHNRFFVIESTCLESDPHLPSVVEVYPGDDRPEREAWNLMGIVFGGHLGLTRTVMPDDWVGYPQRKGYSLGGTPVEYKGAVVPPPDVRRDYGR